MSRTRVLQIITRLIVGGAQENTMLTAALLDPNRYAVDVLSGSQTGSEGSLIDEVCARGIPLMVEPTLVREINPLKDLQTLLALYRHIRRGRYTIVHTHSSKAGVLGRWAAYLAGVPIIVHTVHGWGHHDRQHPLVKSAGRGRRKASNWRIECLTIAVAPRGCGGDGGRYHPIAER